MKCDDVFRCFPLFHRLGQTADSLGGNVESDGEYLLADAEMKMCPTHLRVCFRTRLHVMGSNEKQHKREKIERADQRWFDDERRDTNTSEVVRIE
jgi:hypothetical protein